MIGGYSKRGRKIRRSSKRAGFGSAMPTHKAKSVRGARLAAKIARQSIEASRHGRCSDALYSLTRAFHAQGAGWAHFASLGKAGSRYVGKKSSIGHRAGRISSKVAGTTMAAYNAFVKACVVR